MDSSDLITLSNEFKGTFFLQKVTHETFLYIVN